MSDLLNGHLAGFQSELQAVVAGSQTKMPRQVSPQRLCPADIGPFGEPDNQLDHSRLDRLGQLPSWRAASRSKVTLGMT